jgi:spore germination protein YaaH
MDEADRFKVALDHLSHYETMWLFGPSIEALTAQNTSASDWWSETPAMKDVAAQATAHKIRIGPVLHNATSRGFDADLGLKLIKNPDVPLAALEKEIKSRGWRALNIDLESLPESSADDYEAFLKKLIDKFKDTDIEISICLHPKTDPKGTYEGARFQRWNKLAHLPLSFVIMGYDYSWADSEPGPIAPMTWLNQVRRFAGTQFKSSQIVFALPVFGYHWKKKISPANGWNGTPAIAPELIETVTKPGWQKDLKTALPDGHIYKLTKSDSEKKDVSEVVAYDDALSSAAKIARLRASGITRFAIWRIGGEDGPLYQALEKQQ